MSLFVIPAVTMRTLAAEKGSGTLELLITMPVRDTEVILGKYLAACTMVLILLASTLLYPFAMFVACRGTWAPSTGAPCGPATSAACFFTRGRRHRDDVLEPHRERRRRVLHDGGDVRAPLRHRMGALAAASRSRFADSVDFISLPNRMLSFTRGVIDTRPVVYFVSIAILCVLVSFRSLESRKWS